jgi:hypothetical protein
MSFSIVTEGVLTAGTDTAGTVTAGADTAGTDTSGRTLLGRTLLERTLLLTISVLSETNFHMRKCVINFKVRTCKIKKLIMNDRLEVSVVVIMKNAVFWDNNPSSYFIGNTLLLRYKAQPVNAM